MTILPAPSPDPDDGGSHRAHRPRPGANTTTTANALGFAVNAPPRGQTFNHPFRPFLTGLALTFNLGTVQSFAGVGPIVPTISVGGSPVPMNTGGGTAAPLSLGNVKPNSDGVTWAALEVTPDAVTGELQKGALVQIVHTNLTPISLLSTLGRTALSMILWTGNVPLRVIPIVHFNLHYYRVLPSAGNAGAPKHYFL